MMVDPPTSQARPMFAHRPRAAALLLWLLLAWAVSAAAGAACSAGSPGSPGSPVASTLSVLPPSEAAAMTYRPLRFPENPLIHPGLGGGIGSNINGPALIAAPPWLEKPLGRYYLYFADHGGKHIRLAYADALAGPWAIYAPGVLHLDQTGCRHHIASPDIHLLPASREVVMYFHGPFGDGQKSFRAVSSDGLHFTASPEVLGPPYFRAFTHEGWWYAISMTGKPDGGGVLNRSRDGIAPFERGPDLIPRMRHVALDQRGDLLEIFFSRGEDCPERILVCRMPLVGDWTTWRPGEPEEVLAPELDYEGGHLPCLPSAFGPVHTPARQLRDPAIFHDDGKRYLLYSGAGESCLCAAELLEDGGQARPCS